MTPLTFLIGTIRTKEGAALRNKPIRRPSTTPMGFLVCAAMMGDVGDSVRAAFANEKPGSGSRDGCFRTSVETVTATF